MRNINHLSEFELNHILEESNLMCYREIAREHDVSIGTIKNILRSHLTDR